MEETQPLPDSLPLVSHQSLKASLNTITIASQQKDSENGGILALIGWDVQNLEQP